MQVEIRKIENEDGDYEQYDTIGAVIVLENTHHILNPIIAETILLDNEEDEFGNFKKLDEFINKWNNIAEAENMTFYLDKDVSDLWFILKVL